MKRRGLIVGAAIAAVVLAGTTAMGWWRHLSYTPNAGPNIFDDKATFNAWATTLGLEAMTPADARNRLMLEGFHCEVFDDGGASCYRRAAGSQCGERQFIDLPPSPGNGRISTRFSLACR